MILISKIFPIDGNQYPDGFYRPRDRKLASRAKTIRPWICVRVWNNSSIYYKGFVVTFVDDAWIKHVFYNLTRSEDVIYMSEIDLHLLNFKNKNTYLTRKITDHFWKITDI